MGPSSFRSRPYSQTNLKCLSEPNKPHLFRSTFLTPFVIWMHTMYYVSILINYGRDYVAPLQILCHTTVSEPLPQRDCGAMFPEVGVTNHFVAHAQHVVHSMTTEDLQVCNFFKLTLIKHTLLHHASVTIIR